MAEGRVILLNGASSSGKTSIARALQNRLETPFLYMGIDTFLPMLPGRYFSVNPLATEVSAQGFTWVRHHDERGDYYLIRAGELGRRLILDVMHGTIAALAGQGFDLIVDDVLFEADWLTDYLRVLRGDVWFVQVYCPPEVLIEREHARGDRDAGTALGQHYTIHAHGIYDVTVDTSLISAEEAAEQIKQALERKPTAFDQLRGAKG